jgi:transcriptional regulator of acetoin/glycerol metabolism
LSDSNAAGKLRPEIELAWRRAQLSGLEPSMEVRETAIVDIEKRTSLSVAASPVLDQMVGELADTRFSILLTDRTSLIIDRRVASAEMARALDRVLAVPGFQYLEEASGTNALATAFELRKPIAVTGDEHYLEALKRFCCYGAPIIHPVTHRLEGVIDISGPAAESTALLNPFLTRAVRDVEQRLLEGSRIAEKQLLSEFQVHGNSRHAVLVLGESMVLTNEAAVDLVRGEDHLVLRAFAADLSNHSVQETNLSLSSGLEVLVRARLVEGTRGGAVFELIPSHTSAEPRAKSPWSAVNSSAKRSASVTGPAARIAAVTGEPGTGRTSAAMQLAGSACVVLAGADSVVDESGWFVAARNALDSGRPVVIDDIDVLSVRLATLMADPVRAAKARVVLTCPPLSELCGPHRALVSLALNCHELQPLRSYPHKLPAVAKNMLAQLLPTSSLEIGASALQLLAAHHWPGNLRELQSVLEFSARGRDCGSITKVDLPESFRAHGDPLRPLTMMESVERDAIMGALRNAKGNKAAAAAQLGIGRTTLYERLRRYRIDSSAAGTCVRSRGVTPH